MKSKAEEHEFQCARCGACCSWHGYVIISEDEADKIAEYLKLDARDFLAKFAKLTSNRKKISIKERDNGECVFYDKAGKRCEIYHLRPSQCRRFPIEWRFPGWEKECKGKLSRKATVR
ncbi:MAG TPA: YkgJ family cysteine cluster protein [Victivallales bacterium]|nr:YkgJ family cysteine cluster protein [Victivallales bacterium]